MCLLSLNSGWRVGTRCRWRYESQNCGRSIKWPRFEAFLFFFFFSFWKHSDSFCFFLSHILPSCCLHKLAEQQLRRSALENGRRPRLLPFLAASCSLQNTSTHQPAIRPAPCPSAPPHSTYPSTTPSASALCQTSRLGESTNRPPL